MKNRNSFIGIKYLMIILALVTLLICNICIGSVNLSLGEVWRYLTDRAANTGSQIIWEIRLPRLLASAILGGALAVSGFLLQTYFHNPIAGPFILGISSGAKLAVALMMIVFLQLARPLGSIGMILAAFAGSMISMGFVLLISSKVHQMSILIICGVMIGYLCSAITDFVVTFASDSNIVNLHNWSLGSFSGISWDNVRVMALLVGLLLIGCILISKPMGAFQLGENYARSMGVDVKRFRVELILLSSILSAVVTAFAGPISFVGVAVPHVVKGFFKSSRPILIIPACFLFGASFTLFADLIARTLFSPTELSISSVTSILGTPIVLHLMMKRRK